MPLAVAAFLAARLPLLPHRRIDPDELEHAHAAWSLFEGMLPYKDFFEHHTPWYYYVLRPLFNWFDVDRSFSSAVHFLLLGRGLSLVLTIVSVALVASIGRAWEDRRGGLVAGLLLVGQPFFLQKTIEMRPDVLALVFFLGALSLLLRGIRDDGDAVDDGAAGRGRWRFFAAGLSLGAAIMCTQKMLFVVPGALAGVGFWSLRAGRARIVSALAFAVGVCLPGVLTWALFALHHAGAAFVTNNFLLNATWKHFATNQLPKLIASSWPVLCLAVLGAVAFLVRFFGQGPRRYDGLVLLTTMAGLFLGLLVMPVPHRQYYLMPLPIVCLFAAKGLFVLVDRVAERWRAWFSRAALVLLCVLPVVSVYSAFRDRNDGQLAKLRTVFEHTQPTDLVMDGWEGMGVFRPHAFHYFFLHEEAVAMLPRPTLDAYLDALESGKGRPKLIAMDKNLWSLGPRFTDFVRAHYATSDGFFYFARPGSD